MSHYTERSLNHAMCGPCWLRRWGLRRTPAQVPKAAAGHCCFCGGITTVGIYVRAAFTDPALRYCRWASPFGSAPDASRSPTGRPGAA